ncbi:MAG: family 10 glycosylhydrolase [Phycisphaeraceae bacterium]|nr:family 10 glycosylhydrolase [Phycisphaeraceae bacterium]
MVGARDIWFTNMSACEPASALSDRCGRHQWRVIEYETADHQGALLFAPPDADAPELALPLALAGWHEVRVGLWPSPSHAPATVRFRLTRDDAWRVLQTHGQSIEHVEETLLTRADLTGQSLRFAPPSATPRGPAGIAYVRCIPMSRGQVDPLKQDGPVGTNKRLIAFNDGEGLFCATPRTRGDLESYVASLVDADYRQLNWGIVGEHVGYPTRVGRTFGQGNAVGMNTDLTRQKECIESLIAAGIHPLRTVMDYAHKHGLAFHVYQRMGAFAALPPYDEPFNAKFYDDNPQWRCHLADGRPLMRCSLAHAPVRQHMVTILREAAELGIDGINLNYKRGAPFVMYEQPMLDVFREQTGLDARQLEEWDEPWLRFRAQAVTQFMRELRQVLDDVGDRDGKRLEIGATTHPTPQECLYFGLDLQSWISEGLVDYLTPMGLSHGGKEVDMAHYQRLTQGTRCRLSPFIPMGHDVWGESDDPVRALYERALRYYDQGADGLSLWDSTHYDWHATWHEAVGRLGHVDDLRRDLSAGDYPGGPAMVPLTSLGGNDLTIRTIPFDHQHVYPHGTPHHGWLGL